MTKNRLKNGSLNHDFLNFFFIGMVYFGCLQVNPHIQAVQNMCGKGGLRVFQAKLRADEVDPIFKKKSTKMSR